MTSYAVSGRRAGQGQKSWVRLMVIGMQLSTRYPVEIGIGHKRQWRRTAPLRPLLPARHMKVQNLVDAELLRQSPLAQGANQQSPVDAGSIRQRPRALHEMGRGLIGVKR